MTSILTLRTPTRLFTRARGHSMNEKGHKSRDYITHAHLHPHPAPPPRLLHFNELPEWYQDNPAVQTAYRPVTSSTLPCIHSLTYLHNESLNIYTHLIPAVLSVFAQIYMQTLISEHFPNASLGDKLVFAGSLMAMSVTMILSSCYHLLICHSKEVSGLWLRFDYVGISTLILGSFFSGIWVGFYCEPTLQKMYWTMISLLSLITSTLVLHPKLQGLHFRHLRTTAFIATALSGFAPIIHGIFLYGWKQMWIRTGLPFWLLEGVIYAMGAVFFVSRFPEKKWPGRFDVWGGSHQIWHVLVVGAGVVHFWGIWEAYRWNYENNYLCVAKFGS